MTRRHVPAEQPTPAITPPEGADLLTTPGLARLRALPAQPIHPFRVYLLERGLSLAEGAELLDCSVRTVAAIVNEWRVPNNARLWAAGLGRRPEELFPSTPDKG